MKKLIVGVALAALMLTVGYAASDYIPRKNNSSATWGTNASGEARVLRLTDLNELLVSGTLSLSGPVTVLIDGQPVTVTGAELIAIQAALEGTGASSQEVQGTETDGAARVGKMIPVSGETSGGNSAILFIGDNGELVVGDLSTRNVGSLGYASLIAAQEEGTTVVSPINQTIDNRLITVTDPRSGRWLVSSGTINSGGETQVIAGEVGNTIRVIGYTITVDAASGEAHGSLHWTATESDGETGNIVDQFDSSPEGGIKEPNNELSRLRASTTNEQLNINVALTGGAIVNYSIRYVRE